MAGAADESPQSRQRRRLVQILFFLFLTPYVLALFWLMERSRDWLETGAPGMPPAG